MKPLCDFTEQNKSTYFSLLISDIHRKIDKHCEEWFDGVFKEKVVPEEIYTDNLLMNLDYLFTEAIWIIDIAKKLKLDVSNSAGWLEKAYVKYTAKEDGYKDLIDFRYYNKKEHRPYTEAEIKKIDKECNKIAMEVLDEILKEEKGKKS